MKKYTEEEEEKELYIHPKLSPKDQERIFALKVKYSTREEMELKLLLVEAYLTCSTASIYMSDKFIDNITLALNSLESTVADLKSRLSSFTWNDLTTLPDDETRCLVKFKSGDVDVLTFHSPGEVYLTEFCAFTVSFNADPIDIDIEGWIPISVLPE